MIDVLRSPMPEFAEAIKLHFKLRGPKIQARSPVLVAVSALLPADASDISFLQETVAAASSDEVLRFL